MEIVLNFLLNYITLAVAGIAFVIILVVLFAKRKSLSRNTKLIFTVLLSLIHKAAVPLRFCLPCQHIIVCFLLSCCFFVPFMPVQL